MSEDKDRLNRYVSDRLRAGAKLQREIASGFPRASDQAEQRLELAEKCERQARRKFF